MSDVKNMNMSELIAAYNIAAAALGVAAVESFKSLGAARAAVAEIEAKADAAKAGTTEAPFDADAPKTEGEGAAAPEGGGATDADKAKYNSSGKRGPNQGVGVYAKELIAAGKNNADVLAAVLAKFPQAKTTTSCIAYYRTALKKGGPKADPAALRAKAAELITQAEALEKAQAEEDAAAAAAGATETAQEAAPV